MKAHLIMKKLYPLAPLLLLLTALTLLGFLLAGCATLNPGADPLVVRVEQTLTTANATFDMVLHVDQADRGFWRTNAPAFHGFCEWLRTPVSTYADGNQPRAVAMQLNLDGLKNDYKANKTVAGSNTLYRALLTLNAAVSQSSSWSNIITSPTHL